MIFYFFLLILIIITSFVHSKAKDKNIIFLAFATTFLLLFIPSARRYGIGVDYFQYVQYFIDIDKVNLNRILTARNIIGGEIGYLLLNKSISYMGLDVQWVFVAMSFWSLFFLFIAVPRRSFFIILPLYFSICYLFTYNIIRQGLAFTMGYYSFQLFTKRKYLKCLIIIILASMFHKSAFVYVLLFVLLKLFNISKKKAIIIFVIMVIVNFFFMGKIIYSVGDLAVKTKFYSQYITDSYLMNTFFAKPKFSSGLGAFARYFILVMLLLYVPNNYNKVGSIFVLFLIMIFSDMLSLHIRILLRLAVCFQFAWFVMVDHIIIYKTKYRKMIFSLLYAWIIAIILLLPRGSEFVPYRSI
jgi:hypothetical protein